MSPVTKSLAITLATIFLALAGPLVAQPTFTKAFSPATMGPGSVSTLTFTLDNTGGGSPVNSLAFVDNLPAGVTLATPANPTSTCGVPTLAAANGGTSISFSNGTLGASSTCIVRVLVTSATVGVHTNTTGDLTSSAGNSGSATADLTVTTALPGFSKSFSPSTFPLGSRVTLTFTLDNSVNASPVEEASFVDNLPTGLQVASPSNLTTDCATAPLVPTLTANPGSAAISYDYVGDAVQPAVAAGSSCTVQVDVVSTGGGALLNVSGELQTTILGTNASAGRSAAVLTSTVGQLVLVKEFLADPLPPGGTVDLQFRILNRDRNFAASAVTFSDNLGDAGGALLGLAAIAPLPTNPCGPGSTLSGTTTLVLTGGSIPIAGTCTFTVTLQIPVGASEGIYPNTTGTVQGTVDGFVVGNQATDSLFLFEAPSLSKTFLTNPVGPGATVDLEFTITNQSSIATATGLGFTDDLDAALAGLVATGLPFAACNGTVAAIPNTGTIDFSGGSIGPGASCTFSVSLQLPAMPGASSVVNTTSSITGTVNGVVLTGNPASDTLSIQNLAFSKSFDGPTAAGGTAVLEFTIDELASSATSDLSFVDNLEATLSGLVATGLPLVDPCGAGSSLSGPSALTLTGGSLLANGSCTFGVTVQIPAGATPGNYLNTTSDLFVAGVPEAGPAFATLDIEPPPTFAKAFAPAFVGVGQVSTLTLTIDNSASALAATGAAFTDNLPAAVTVATSPSASTTCTGGTLTATAGSGVVSYSGGTVAAGASCTVQVDTTSNTPGDHVNVSGDLTSSLGNSGTATDTLSVSTIPSFDKVFAQNPIIVGGTSTLTFTIDNSTGVLDANTLDFTDNLPAAVTVATPPNASTTCTGGTITATASTGIVGYSGGSLVAGATCTVSVDTTSVTAGNHINTSGDLTSSLGNSGTASDTLTADPAPVLTFTKAFLAGPILPGGLVGLEFTITNPATTGVVGISFSDDLSAVITGLAATGLPQNDVCGVGSQLSGAGVITLTGGSLAAGASCTFAASVLLPVDAPSGVFTNTTSVLSYLVGPVALQSPAAAADLEVAFLTFTKEFDPDAVTAGETASLSFTITNPDPVNAVADLTFADDLDAMLSGLVATDLPQNDICGFGSLLDGTATVTLTGGSLPAGGSCTFSTTVQVPADAQSADYTNVTSPLSATVGGNTVIGDPADVATDDLSVTASVVVIPTLGEWALVLLAGVLMLLGWRRLTPPPVAD
ncbi:MAG: IPTL-CTERM sorting domain-containing protein [Thermoanaerobaculia bacterium]|nr:IPTL-CTERM sorting domain-containing protein [Thermoanaerobaculia bacterium]